MALQPGVGLGLRHNMPPGPSVPCSISPFVYTHISQVHGHVIQPSHSWSSSSSCCIQLSVQHLFWNCGGFRNSYFLQGETVSLTPNPQPGGPGYPLLSGPSPSTCPARVALPVADATAPVTETCKH